MIYHRIVALLLLLSISLSLFSCGKDEKEDFVHKDGTEDVTDDTPNPEPETTNPIFVYSTSSKTLHRESCYHAVAIDELYKKTYDGDATLLIEKGFSFCALCCPEESELYNEKDDETIDNGISPEDASYVINIGSGKFHEPECRYATEMNPDNRLYTDLSKDELIMNGYSPCKTCNP